MPVSQTQIFSQKPYRLHGSNLLSVPGMVTRFIAIPVSVLHQLSYTTLILSEQENLQTTHVINVRGTKPRHWLLSSTPGNTQRTWLPVLASAFGMILPTMNHSQIYKSPLQQAQDTRTATCSKVLVRPRQGTQERR